MSPNAGRITSRCITGNSNAGRRNEVKAKNTVAPSEKPTTEQESEAVAVSLARSGNQNNLRNIGLIIEREFKNRVTQRSFKISTAIILILIVIGSTGVLLVINRTPGQDVQYTYYTTANPVGDSNVTNVQGVASQLSILDRASRLGLTPDQTSKLFAQTQFSVVNVGQSQIHRSVSDIVAGYILAYAGIILIFMSVYLYGVTVANGVAEEKGSRIMEILVNAATPFQLMTGKIIGIGAAGLTQMTAFVIVGISALLIQNPIKAALLGNNSSALNLNITGSSITLLLLLLVYFILGFLLYATLFAAMGALVKRQDEVQNAIQPLTWLFMIGYFVSFFGIYNPDATWVKVVSYIPFWTPTTMLMRIGVGSATWWEIAITIVIMIVAIFVCAIFAARIYRYGVLMYGQKPSIRQLFKIARLD